MKLGLIGKPLGHSWSKEIHDFFLHEDYQLWELSEEELPDFFKKRDFDGINVTIPYKEKVMAYLDEIDETALKMRAVNCIVNRDGKLCGFNSDAPGLKMMLERNGVKASLAAILGSGGASRAAMRALNELQIPFVQVSRSKQEGTLSYDELCHQGQDIELLINATPVGMYPRIDECIVDPDYFPELEWVVDIVANPLRSRLQYEAAKRNIRQLGGLEMLVRQAFIADELFTGRKLDETMIDDCYRYLRQKKMNIVLIGMPSAGKTTIAALLGEKMNRSVIDTDEVFTERYGNIPAFFAQNGEEAFRRHESEIVNEASLMSGKIIACGGGVVLREENMFRLRSNSTVFWLDRDLSKLQATASRPLSSDRNRLAGVYEERKQLYETYADIRIDNNGQPDKAVEEIVLNWRNIR